MGDGRVGVGYVMYEDPPHQTDPKEKRKQHITTRVNDVSKESSSFGKTIVPTKRRRETTDSPMGL